MNTATLSTELEYRFYRGGWCEQMAGIRPADVLERAIKLFYPGGMAAWEKRKRSMKSAVPETTPETTPAAVTEPTGTWAILSETDRERKHSVWKMQRELAREAAKKWTSPFTRLSGCAVMFGAENPQQHPMSEWANMPSHWPTRYSEVYEAGCFDSWAAKRESINVHANHFHDPGCDIIASTADGTLALSITPRGLYVTADSYDYLVPWNLNGWSVSYVPIRSEWNRAHSVYTIHEAELREVSLVGCVYEPALKTTIERQTITDLSRANNRAFLLTCEHLFPAASWWLRDRIEADLVAIGV